MRCFMMTALLLISMTLSLGAAAADNTATACTVEKPWPTQTVSVQRVDESTSTTDQPSDDRPTGDSPAKQIHLYSFPGAAHFAWAAFDREEQALPREALTIYEGMSISIDSNGNYEVRYQVEAPMAEITLRMQLHFQTTCGKCGTITLAPVHIHESREENRNVSSQSFLVVQRGNSVALRRAHCPLVAGLSDAAVLAVPPFSRTGTARFGAVPMK